MKTYSSTLRTRGFTLMELMVAMAITTIIVTVLVSITSIALDTWNRSRSELRASRQAKAAVDVIALDLESAVRRMGNVNEWLSCESDVPGSSSNASKLIFFTAAADRYNGMIGDSSVDKGGDVSCVGYRLSYKDPINGGDTANQTFVLNRYLVDPKPAFDNLLGQTSKTITLSSKFTQYESELAKEVNFICENIFQFTISFHVTVLKNVGSDAQPVFKSIPVIFTTSKTDSGLQVDTFRLMGDGIVPDFNESATVGGVALTAAEIKTGKLTAVGISLTVLSDLAVDAVRTNKSLLAKPEYVAKNSYQYSKLIQVYGM